MAAHQVPLSLGFSRQEHWSGLPFPSPMHESEKWSEVAQSCPTLSDPKDCSLSGSSVHGIFQARVLEWGAIAFSEWLRAGISKFFCEYFSFCGPFQLLISALQYESSKRQYINEQICCVPIKLYLLALKLELNIIFMGHKLLLLLKKKVSNVKSILSLQALQNQVVDWISPISCSLPTPGLSSASCNTRSFHCLLSHFGHGPNFSVP